MLAKSLDDGTAALSVFLGSQLVEQPSSLFYGASSVAQVQCAIVAAVVVVATKRYDVVLNSAITLKKKYWTLWSLKTRLRNLAEIFIKIFSRFKHILYYNFHMF